MTFGGISIGLVLGISLIGLSSQVVRAKTVNYGSLTPTQRARSYMKLSVGKQDRRYALNKVMLPISVKLKNTTNQAYRYYFTQLYVDSHGLDGEISFYRVHGPHKHVTVQAHSTKTVKKAFYENDQYLLGWVVPGSGHYTYLKYGKYSGYYVELFKNNKLNFKRLTNRTNKYYVYGR
ncbi:hypothetical protein [Lactiplantibacillus songbeiensis]|uniref:DUF4352 domain-containing protein n=1 Tax=Lactiplantibacillus songbeiensis TaxID=2559920 RepID=A0ABW4C1F0_9LACO|nr:hypothetical protein [Lactiplantibacillus songbeiensis]